MLDRLARLVAHGEHQAIVGERQAQRIGAGVVRFEREAVLLQEIEDGDLALMLDLGLCAADRGLVERHLDQPRLVRPGPKLFAVVLLAHGLVSWVEPDGDGTAMGVEPFGFGQRHGGGAERGEAARRRA